MTNITEIGPEIFRISTLATEFNLQFNQFLVRDDEPLLFHTGMKRAFPGVRDAVASLIDPARLRWISFSHFEADECGSLNEWLEAAPQAQTACSLVGALVSVNDTSIRPARPLADGEILATGTKRFRFLQTPHVPHCWEAGMLFEESTKTLFCSDLLDQPGDPAPTAGLELLERHRQGMIESQSGPFAHYMPYTPTTEPILQRLADLRPERLATMHGSSLLGDGAAALREEAVILREVFGSPAAKR